MSPVTPCAVFVLVLLQPPSLPALAIETYPAAAREDIAAAYRDAAARDRDGAAAGALGQVLQAWEQWDAAHSAYERAGALDPRVLDWPYLDAVVLQRLARHDESIVRLRAALAIDAGYLPARVRLAEVLLESGDAGQAAPLFAALVSEPAAEPAARVGLGRIAALAGRQDEAIAHFSRAVQLFPELGAAHYGMARAYRALGRDADAARELSLHAQFGARWPRLADAVLERVTARRADGRALLSRGIATLEAGDVPAAIAAHEAALARDPSLVQIHANLLSLYGRAGEWDKADAHYRAAIAAGIRTADVYHDYGLVQARQERWEAAEAAYRQAAAVNPLHTGARLNLGQLLERRGDYTAAADEYRLAVDSQPSLRLARFNLARMLLATNRTDAAITELEPLQQPVDAETPRYVFALATAHVRAGHRAEGVRLATESRDLAARFGQTELAAAIDRELAKLK